MIGFVSSGLLGWDLARIVDFAVSTGFDGIVLNAHRNSPLDVRTFDPARRAQLQKLFEANRCGITAVADMSLNLLHPNDDERAAQIVYMRQLIDLSAALDVGLVTMFAGRDPEKSVEENIPRFGEVFTPLADYAGERGVRIAFENCPLFEYFPYRGRNIAYTPAAWDLMFDAVPANNLGIELDTAHPVWLQQDLAQLLRDYAARIFHVHLKDCRVDHTRLHAASIYGDGWWSYETPGDGDIDWPGFFAALQAIHYNGDLTFDLKGETRLTELPRGLAYVRPILISPEERARMFQEYNEEQSKRDAFQQGEEIGMSKGEQKRNVEIARALLLKGMAHATIAEITGLNEAEIRTLQALKD